ncbi:hypothetical protein GGX14DRAFT_579349 [Mycena pura]|uniref:Uncharacterized protein n=1 Tax=Mycena pura TaxID=153505 RepID=A0AAD6UPM5_9AGAR|nr:hypothetical protein GGX14DRAFT_579349 [Mycena pura]
MPAAGSEADAEMLKVRVWRYTVQRIFKLLAGPNARAQMHSVMPALDELFTLIEQYPNIAYLRVRPRLVKMDRVLHYVERLDEHKVPRDGEFHFRARAKAILDRWGGK